MGSLTALGLLDKFDILVCAEDYKHGKPAPDGFLLAASKLGVAPEHCLVFEDTDLGIQAATAAGMESVLVAQPVRENCGTGAQRGNVSCSSGGRLWQSFSVSTTPGDYTRAMSQIRCRTRVFCPCFCIAVAAAAAPHRHQRPLWLPSRRTAVPERRAASRLGLCLLSAAHAIYRAHRPWPLRPVA